ncbi:MAG: hypothetical protein LBV75_06560 [Paludibacter sp.]|jgi:hypothetical protein|nr:hypothetical protein [Paludibacter sp.]
MKPKNLIFVFCGVLFFSSCVSTEGFTKAALNTLKPTMMGTPMQNTDYLQLGAAAIPVQDEQVSTRRTKTFFVPAIFLWAGGESTQTEINNQYFINLFSEVMYHKDKIYNLRDKLDGRILEINLTKVPNLYEYHSRWFGYFLVYVYGGGAQKRFCSGSPLLAASYVLKDKDGITLEMGTVATERKNEMYSNGTKSGTAFAEQYFHNLDNEFYDQSSDLLEQIFKKSGLLE